MMAAARSLANFWSQATIREDHGVAKVCQVNPRAAEVREGLDLMICLSGYPGSSEYCKQE